MHWLTDAFYQLIRWPTRLLVSAKAIPTDLSEEIGLDPNKPILYLLKQRSVTDIIALEKITEQFGLPKPMHNIAVAGKDHAGCLFLENPPRLFGREARRSDIDQQFTELFRHHRQDPELDIQILPVSIFWGRAPGKATAGWADLLAYRASPNWLRKFFILLLLGRDNFVYFSPAVSSRYMTGLRGSDEHIAHKLIRVARTHFHRRRIAFVGPRQVERQQLLTSVLASDAVKQAIAEEALGKKLSQDKARQRAVDYAEEIAADYREGLIRLADRVLTWLWNKIYKGINVHHADKVRELARNGHEIIYVPCHRSHMDYLLLTYSIYREGLATPHIAAGINLNFWPAGPIFRRAGAFFLRRSFGGNKLYTAVFREYLEQLFNRGYSVKYYPEGGRSRTGRLLPPKTGMLAMTVQALLKGVNRPVSLVPVYIGYEHVMEVNSYLKELKGRNKQKESFWGIFSAIGKLRNYGQGYLNFGEPIHLTRFLDTHEADWRKAQASPEKKPKWLSPVTNALSLQVMRRINQSAAVSGLSLCSLCLLSARQHSLSKTELIASVDHFIALLKGAPYSSSVTLPELTAPAMVEEAIKLDKYLLTDDDFGSLVSLDDSEAVGQTYYRNNILHLFVLPGMLAAHILRHPGIEADALNTDIQALYPLLQKEWFLHFKPAQVAAHLTALTETLVTLNLVRRDGDKLYPAAPDQAEYMSLKLLSQTVQDILQRYHLVLTLLVNEQQVNRGALERQSRALAERLGAMYGIDAPEYYDKALFSTFIQALRENHLIASDDEGMLCPNDASYQLSRVTGELIDEDIAHTIKGIHSV